MVAEGEMNPNDDHHHARLELAIHVSVDIIASYKPFEIWPFAEGRFASQADSTYNHRCVFDRHDFTFFTRLIVLPFASDRIQSDLDRVLAASVRERDRLKCQRLLRMWWLDTVFG